MDVELCWHQVFDGTATFTSAVVALHLKREITLECESMVSPSRQRGAQSCVRQTKGGEEVGIESDF